MAKGMQARAAERSQQRASSGRSTFKERLLGLHDSHMCRPSADLAFHVKMDLKAAEVKRKHVP